MPSHSCQVPVGIALCKTNLFFGFFFDGTKNNYVQAEAGKNHSNLARLYDCCPGKGVKGVLPDFKVYIPGVASPFSQVNDSGEGMEYTRGDAADVPHAYCRAGAF